MSRSPRPAPRTTPPDGERALDGERFAALVEPHRRELTLHCYRMLGSFQDAEDLVQETMLRAWRGRDAYQGRASLRTWLYRIATNASLDALAARARRQAPAGGGPDDPADPQPAPRLEPPWLEPVPGELVAGVDHDPAARYDRRESVTLAFVAALQRLSPRQRAVLILRDVLAWRAKEVAELLDESLPTVNSLLFRARRTLRREHPAAAAISPAAAGVDAELLRRYVRAWEAADVGALVALLREDAVYSMPPLPVWYQGRAAIERFLRSSLLAEGTAGRWRLLATEASGEPAFAVYERDAAGSGDARASALVVIGVRDGRIARMTTFLHPGLVTRFGLPPALGGAEGQAG
ncbi:MAG TPA: sigma-70 family RNA polymerase sigma factor [Actinomycetes bacterium]|nr:sigma-70 family RNA polymerase sigma factor [Actinomycetes bacterium]